MRMLRIALTLGAIMLSLQLVRTHAQEGEVSFQVFYDQLGGYGSWIQTDTYGYCWRPNIEDEDWRPYSVGYWVETDYGWTWVSDEPWGWATYHYGRWANLEDVGWVWVPGYRWAPAWVSWRYGDGYCGWAPLPPESFVDVEYASGGGLAVGFDFLIGDDCDRRYHIGADWYNFIPVTYLGSRHYQRHYWRHGDNFRLFNRTRNITHIAADGRHADRRLFARGPSLKEVNSLSKNPVPHRRLEFSGEGRPRPSQLKGDALAVYAPRVRPEARKQPGRPSNVARTLNHPRVRRGQQEAGGNDVSSPTKVAPGQAQPQLQTHVPPSTESFHSSPGNKMEHTHAGRHARRIEEDHRSDEHFRHESSSEPSTAAAPEAQSPPHRGQRQGPPSHVRETYQRREHSSQPTIRPETQSPPQNAAPTPPPHFEGGPANQGPGGWGGGGRERREDRH